MYLDKVNLLKLEGRMNFTFLSNILVLGVALKEKLLLRLNLLVQH
jgi:hypothetical protein